MEKNTVLVAGGTGLVGKALVEKLKQKGHTVKVLTRGKSNPDLNIYNWDIKNKSIDKAALKDVDTVINLVGAGIADKKMDSKTQKKNSLILE